MPPSFARPFVHSPAREALVVGCGVIGLTTAVRLQAAGFAVKIVARELPAETTSAVAGAVWYPYKAYPEDRVLPWSRHTLDVFYDLAEEPGTGVAIVPLLELFDHAREDPWWKSAVRQFRRATPDELRPGYIDGFMIEVPLVETPVYLRYLLRRFKAAGGQVEQREIGRLADVQEEGVLVVNCAGLGARTLANDEAVYPIRGQVVRVTNPGLNLALIEEHGPLAMTYIFPRREDCILGGTAEAHAWDLKPQSEITETILRNACLLEPRLEDAEVLEIKVGLRPARAAVRLEREETPDGLILHNYGHGGAGFTLSWGCAEEAVGLLHASPSDG